MAGELDGRLGAVEAELGDVESRLGNLYEALETKHLTLEALSPRILALRHRQDQLTGAKEEAESQLEQRRVDLPDTKEIKGYVEDIHTCLQEGTLLERKALIRNFVKSIEVVGEEATLTYTIPMPRDGVTSEGASVLDFVQSGPRIETRTRHQAVRRQLVDLTPPNQLGYATVSVRCIQIDRPGVPQVFVSVASGPCCWRKAFK